MSRLDEDGYVWIEGRTDGVFIRGGFKIPYDELGPLLAEHPAREPLINGIFLPGQGEAEWRKVVNML